MRPRTVETLVGWYEITAGAAGVVVVAALVPQILRQTPQQYLWQLGLVVASATAGFGVVILAGVLLVRHRPRGIPLSTLVQAAQIPILSVGPFRWTLFAGAYLAPVQYPNELRILFGLKSTWDLSWAGSGAGNYFGLNVAPLLLIWVLWRFARENSARAAEVTAEASDATGAA